MSKIPHFEDGFHIVVKRDCPTCRLIEPVYTELNSQRQVSIYSQDDPTFPTADVVDDTAFEYSFHLNIDTAPTLIKFTDGKEEGRTVGWDQTAWRELTEIADLGEGLPAQRPGCGAINVLPSIAEALQVRYGDTGIVARRIEVDQMVDPIEHAYERGWSDGLPVVPPTPARVLRMLQGTQRAPDEIVAVVPPNMVACSVEKVAINAVMAGCKPEYLPVVLAAVEAACVDKFALHGVLATTYFSGPIVIVNGPIAQKIGMNSGINVLGQGNRANSTIGRALQLVVRNVGGGVPGGVDRAVLGYPGKHGFCFAEREHDSPWESLAVTEGFSAETSTVTLFGGGGVQPVFDQLARDPHSLTRTFATCLRTVTHPKIPAGDALLIISPPHARTYKDAGWSKARLLEELHNFLKIPGEMMVRGADGIDEGLPEPFRSATIPKFRDGGIIIVHAGGDAGLFSAIIPGWASSGERGTMPVTKAIEE